MVDFARPWILLLLPLLGALAWWGARRNWTLPQSLPGLAGGSVILDALPPFPWCVRILALAVLTLALAGPGVRDGGAHAPGGGVTIMIALDLSSSMAIRDMGGRSRLEVARDAVLDFVEARPGDRMGLVTFAGEAVTRVPPTTHHAFLRQTLASLRIAPEGDGTAMGVGLGLAAHGLLAVPSPSRVVILVTDGRNNMGGIGPLPAARSAMTLGIRVHAVGLGEGVGDDPLNEELLREVAEIGGGRYLGARDSGALERVLESVDAMERGPHLGEFSGSPQPIHLHLALVGVFLLLLEGLLGAAPGGRVP